MTDPAAMVRAFKIQADICTAFGSPFCAALLEQAAADVAGGGVVAKLATPWAEAGTRALMTDAVPLRWLGSGHDMVLAGDARTGGGLPFAFNIGRSGGGLGPAPEGDDRAARALRRLHEP
jgi:hypothetical protein